MNMTSFVVTPREEVAAVAEHSGSWEPSIGLEAKTLVKNKLPENARDEVLNTSTSILGEGADPRHPSGSSAGVVVGYVQSGKTLSFTTVAALARDNGFALVVLVAGISTALLRQSTERMTSDLRVSETGRNFDWVLRTNPRDDGSEIRFLENKLDEWRDENVPAGECPTVLITVMKNHTHLRNLTAVLKKLNLSGISALIIDDEADQASLNTQVKLGEESTTYANIKDLRSTIPNHTFLQYTATPQANLLINMIDALSPDFVRVLEPGNAYVGGKEIFSADSRLTSVIPFSDIPADDEPLDGMTASLSDALCDFMIGVCQGMIDGSHRRGHRSMLVHPSRRTSSHFETYTQMGSALALWRNILELGEGDPDRAELLEMFEAAYDRIKMTVPTIAPFETVISVLQRALRHTELREVNARSGRTPEIDWRSSYAWILVGGQAMDRGFTVEGLTVTYMPRGAGMGNADVIQQRGQFFGYKGEYLGYCRVYLEQDVLSAFSSYVQHEEHMRESLKEFQVSGKPLDEWKRLFVLSPDLKPCRDNVIEHGYLRPRLNQGWITAETTKYDDEHLADCHQIIARFVDENLDAERCTDLQVPPSQRHYVSNSIPLRVAISDLLAPCMGLATSGGFDDSLATLLMLANVSESSTSEMATVYRMRPEMVSRRSLGTNGTLRQIFQGPSPASKYRARGATYAGDRSYHHQEQVTVQIHMFQINDTSPKTVPVLTIWIPERLRPDLLIQVQ